MKAKELFGKLGYKKQVSFDSICFVYENEDTTDFEIIFDLKSKKIHTHGACSDKSISIDELNAIYKQCEELGWIEEEKQEIKQETNFEHYKDGIIEFCLEDLAISKGKISKCNETSCDECIFSDKNGACIGQYKIKDWFNKPCRKSPYKLSKWEYDLLNAYKNSGMRQCISNYSTLLEMYGKGHFKGIDTSTPIHEILDNCEVID